MDGRKYSDQGKGQATSQRRALDVVKRVSQDTERQRLQNKPEVRQRRTSSRESPSELKKIERRLEGLHVSKPRERNLEGQQQRQGDRHTSNSHQVQRYAIQQRWKANRGDSSVTSNPNESPRHGLQRQGNKVKSRPNERKSPLGQLKGGGPGESSKKPDEETSEQQEKPSRTYWWGDSIWEEQFMRWRYDH